MGPEKGTLIERTTHRSRSVPSKQPLDFHTNPQPSKVFRQTSLYALDPDFRAGPAKGNSLEARGNRYLQLAGSSGLPVSRLVLAKSYQVVVLVVTRGSSDFGSATGT